MSAARNPIVWAGVMAVRTCHTLEHVLETCRRMSPGSLCKNKYLASVRDPIRTGTTLTLGLVLCSVVLTPASAQQAATAALPVVEFAPLQLATAAPPLPPAGSLEERIMSALQTPLPSPAGDLLVKPARDDTAGANSFYTARTFAPLWVTANGYSSRALTVIAELQRAEDWGLSRTEFVVPVPQTSLDLDALAAAEVTLTRAVLKYARHARGGRIPDPGAQLSSFIDRKPQLLAPATVLEQMSASTSPDATLRKLNPQHVGFERLRQAYIKARDSAADRANMTLPPGLVLSLGTTHPTVSILRRRLAVPALAPTEPDLYDAAVLAAVRKFQAEAGLRSTDGRVGEKTRLALNASGTATTSGLLANMEQWRWMPESLGATHVTVNIPEFTTRLVRSGVIVHAERVVTGKLETSTPIFSQSMETIVFQPKWGVPESIKVNELLPRLQSGRGLTSGLRMALNGRDIDPWSVDWSRADIRRYTVYQPSGDDNALGSVKFLFPNKHSVYMHDTPSKNLFNAASRTYSHGCIRVRNPVRLAELVLGSDKGWNAGRVRELVEDGPADNAVKLDTKIPVHVTYFTAVVDETGNVATFADVYGHERRITLALEGKPNLIARLEPAPLGSGRPAEAYDNGQAVSGRLAGSSAIQPARRGSVEIYAPPAALGYAPPPAKKSFWQSGSSGPRYRGNTTNDVIMRQLGGGF
jgi:L,D-transpeptidase YcbB